MRTLLKFLFWLGNFRWVIAKYDNLPGFKVFGVAVVTSFTSNKPFFLPKWDEFKEADHKEIIVIKGIKCIPNKVDSGNFNLILGRNFGVTARASLIVDIVVKSGGLICSDNDEVIGADYQKLLYYCSKHGLQLRILV